MVKLIFNALLNFMKTIVNIFMTPINLLVVNLFPDLSSLLSSFNSAVSKLVGSSIGYFSSMLPPITRSMILLYLGLLISWYTITVSVHAVLKIVNIIRRVKVW